MKELSIEEKAKRYDEALERASKLRVQNPFDTVSQMIEHVFPELAESEDKRIRAALIRYFTLSDEHAYNEAYGVSYRDIVAWVIKQGERNPVEWSEEDEEYLNDIIRTLRNFVSSGGSKAKEYTEEEINWLKSKCK